ncbi:MAG: T9SS type A sorting domain-containing protein, partial [Bacteroidetes bacterium]|nr:T9SS type A sorting domain-containing protein [Bacteroidota bacterium]
YGDPSSGLYRTWISKVKSTDASLGITRNTATVPYSLVYPNPASTIVTVEFETSHKAAISADVYDLTGKLVAHVYEDAAKDGLNRFSFNTQALPKGNYLLKIFANEGVLTSKLFVVN